MKKILPVLLRLVPALILIQTLFFKFTAAPESVAIFEQLGMEPAGRIGIGVLEALAAGLLLLPATVVYGAILTFLLMSGALMSHVTHLGFSGDMGSLAVMALVVWGCSLALIWTHRTSLPKLPRKNS